MAAHGATSLPLLLPDFAERATRSAGRIASMAKSSTKRRAAVPATSIAGRASAIDMEHLAHMTLGERDLEVEVLRLFERQAELLLSRMREVGPEGVAALAHTLSGSAKGVGAWRGAGGGEAAECAVKEHAPLDPAMAGLAASVAEAR